MGSASESCLTAAIAAREEALAAIERRMRRENGSDETLPRISDETRKAYSQRLVMSASRLEPIAR